MEEPELRTRHGNFCLVFSQAVRKPCPQGVCKFHLSPDEVHDKVHNKVWNKVHDKVHNKVHDKAGRAWLIRRVAIRMVDFQALVIL